MTYPLPKSKASFWVMQKCTKGSQNNIMKSYVDSTGQVARVTTFMRDIATGNMKKMKPNFGPKSTKYFLLIAIKW
jgi:hypothetical protein